MTPLIKDQNLIAFAITAVFYSLGEFSTKTYFKETFPLLFILKIIFELLSVLGSVNIKFNFSEKNFFKYISIQDILLILRNAKCNFVIKYY